MMINDDLDAFAQIPRILGRSAAATIQSAIFEIFNTNPNNIFSAANGNLLTGAGSALSMESLGQAITLFYKQTDAAGLPIMLTPRYLVVPPELAFTAESILASNQVNETTTAGTPSPAGNPFQGLLTLIVSPWLSNATMTGSSATAWLVLADPGVGGVVNVAYLRGRRIPIIETSETDFDTLGMRWRGFFDFGVGVMDYRAGVKSEGTGAVILAATPTKESKTSKSGG
jgi:hypothetical protein